MSAFTHLNDPRWNLLEKYLVLHQDPKNPLPQKLGSFNSETWGAYLLNGLPLPAVPAHVNDLRKCIRRSLPQVLVLVPQQCPQ